jgi:hypothetical protein
MARVLVSLTTTSGRTDIARYAVESILRQSLRPDRLYMAISKEPYLADEGIEVSPPWTRELEGPDFEVLWVENTGPYRKLLPLLDSVGDDDLIVTADDDAIYRDGWLQALVDCARAHPYALVCGQARYPAKNVLGIRQSYLNWPLVGGLRSRLLVPIGRGGVCYRRPLLSRNLVGDGSYRDLAPTADDLWFKVLHYVAGTEVVVASEAGRRVAPIEAGAGLFAANGPKPSLGGLVDEPGAPWARVVRKGAAFAKGYLGLPVTGNDAQLKAITSFLESRYGMRFLT